jgi:hypothetical protein
MKNQWFYFMVFLLLSVNASAAKIPSDFLDANVALVLFEFDLAKDPDAILAQSRQTLESKGLNIVSMHNVSDRYDAEVALADMKAKNVKYIIKVLFKFFRTDVYYINVFSKAEMTDPRFLKYESASFITEGGITIDRVLTRTTDNITHYQKKKTLSNDVPYSRSLADTILFTSEDALRMDYLKDKRNRVDQLMTYKSDELPADIAEEKIAFVCFDKQDMPNEAALGNSLVESHIHDLPNCEVFKNYDDYLKRKGEFRYRILISSNQLIFRGIKQPFNHVVTSGFNKGPEGYQRNKSLSCILVRDERNGDIYKCTDFDWLNASSRIFVKKVLKK